jgi:hypothetical protein
MIIKDDAMNNKSDNKHQSDDDQQGQQGVAKMQMELNKKFKNKTMQTYTKNK